MISVLVSAPKIKILPGEKRRERVVMTEEEARYLAAAPEPLASIATVLPDTGMRPEECFRFRWEYVTWLNGRNGAMLVTHGKTSAARRVIPMTPRVRAVLESRWNTVGKPDEGFVWPAQTRSGHVEPSSLRKQHARRFKTVAEEAARNNQKPVRPFVLYSFRHTFLTRLGQSGCDAWTLARIAGAQLDYDLQPVCSPLRGYGARRVLSLEWAQFWAQCDSGQRRVNGTKQLSDSGMYN